MGIAWIFVTAGLLLLLAAEHILLRHARKQFFLVIHVNGTRGKSTVTRMIHALLRCHGLEVFGKTTGSAARYLLPDGSEKAILRIGPANVREQRNMMILSAFSKKRQKTALVFECNAVRKEMQDISMQWLKPDITIITNVREDHVQELGNTEQAAQVFAKAVPDNTVLVTSENKFMGIWETAAKQKSLTLKFADPDEAENASSAGFSENIACVLAVADHLGIDRRQALESIAGHKPDTGAFGVYFWKTGSRSVFFADARAANDIESTGRLASIAFRDINPDGSIRRILLLINREDRPDRTWLFLQYIIKQHKKEPFDQYLCLGHTPFSFRKKLKYEGLHYRILRHIKDLDAVIEEAREQEVHILAAGNYGGAGKHITLWLQDKKKEPDFRKNLQ